MRLRYTNGSEGCPRWLGMLLLAVSLFVKFCVVRWPSILGCAPPPWGTDAIALPRREPWSKEQLTLTRKTMLYMLI